MSSDKIKESFAAAEQYLVLAYIHIMEADIELDKWKHPVQGEILGLAKNVEVKIERMKELQRFEDEDNERVDGE